MTQQLAVQTFGTPLLVQRTFLQFDLRAPAVARAKSAPPNLARSPRKTSRPKKKRPRQEDKDDEDEAALREGRRQTLCETWQVMADGIAEKTQAEASEELEARRMKFRDVLSCGGFVQLVKILGYTELDLVVLSMKGMIREGDGECVEIWCTDDQMRHQRMKKFLEEVVTIRGLCETSIFLMLPCNAALVVCHSDSTSITTLRRKVRKFCGLSPSHEIAIEYMSGLDLKGKTLAEAGLRAGDSVRVLYL
jgi:hypothetical protein